MNIRITSFVGCGVLLLALCSAGCGGASPKASAPKLASRAAPAADEQARKEPEAQDGMVMAGKPARGAVGGEAAGKLPTPMPRKVIYNATVDLIAEDLGAAEQELRQLVKRAKGYIAKSELRGTVGTHRSGTWTIRVPVNQLGVTSPPRIDNRLTS